jgi:hypothetical protein
LERIIIAFRQNGFISKYIKVMSEYNDGVTGAERLGSVGNSARVYEKQEKGTTAYYADVTVSETAIIYWSLQYGGVVEIIAPTETRAKIAKMSEKIADKYNEKV